MRGFWHGTYSMGLESLELLEARLRSFVARHREVQLQCKALRDRLANAERSREELRVRLQRYERQRRVVRDRLGRLLGRLGLLES